MELRNVCLYEVMYDVLFEFKHRVMNGTVPVSAARCMIYDFIIGINELHYYLNKVDGGIQVLNNMSCKDFVDCNLGVDVCAYKNFAGLSELSECESCDKLKGKCYVDENGFVIDEDGHVLEEPGTDADFDRYAVDVQNGDGYYDSTGRFCRYRCGDYD